VTKKSIKERAQAILTLVKELVETPGLTWVDASNAVYAPGGPFGRMFLTEAERIAFGISKEGKQIDDLIASLPEPPVRPLPKDYSGKFNVRIPKSLHAALATEAEAEGVSLNQLVVAKLAMHSLRR
jgi:predicted HicB family RNase H-like nuclease